MKYFPTLIKSIQRIRVTILNKQAKFKLQEFSDEILTEIFSYIEPTELLEFQFLNKNLFRVIRYVIKQHLKISAYTSHPNFREVQIDFIVNNYTQMKHLVIRDDIFDMYFYFSINLDPNRSLLTNFPSIDNVNLFTNLKQLNLRVYSIDLMPFHTLVYKLKDILYKLESFILFSRFRIDLDEILKLLNPTQLRYLYIWQEGDTLRLRDISKFGQFKLLQKLILRSINYHFNSVDLNNSIPTFFNSLKELGLYRYMNQDGFNYKLLGQLNKLNKLYVNSDDGYYEMLDLIENTPVKPFHLVCSFESDVDHDISDIPIFFESILDIQSIKILELRYVTDTLHFSKTRKLNIPDDLNENIFINNQIEKITFNNSKIYIQSLFYLSRYFPRVKVICFKDGALFNNGDQIVIPHKIYKHFLLRISRNSVKHNCREIKTLCKEVNVYIY